MAAHRALAPLLLALVAVVASAAAGHGVWCAFASKAAANGSDTITAAADFTAPSTSARTIGRYEGGAAGLVRPGGSYYLYAQTADKGSPASGVSTVTANLSALTSGQTAAKLSAGSFEFGTTAYDRRSSKLTAKSSGLPDGTYTYSVTLTDTAGNSRTESGYTVTVDGTAPTAADVQTINKAGDTAGRPELGDKIIFTFSEPPDPDSILADWDGSPLNTVVRMENGSGSADDRMRIYNGTNSTLLRLGTVEMGRNDYLTTSRTFGANGTPSTAVLDDDTITVTLGTASGAVTTAAAAGQMEWTPVATATDPAGNAMSVTARTETGSADKDF